MSKLTGGDWEARANEYWTNWHRSARVAAEEQMAKEQAQCEVERLRREGVPGVVHEVDKAFHRVVLSQRNHAWEESARHKRERDEALAACAALRASSGTEPPPPSTAGS